MTIIEHGELVRRALEYVQEERCRIISVCGRAEILL